MSTAHPPGIANRKSIMKPNESRPSPRAGLSRRKFVHATAAVPALGLLDWNAARAQSPGPPSEVFRVNDCPVHDGRLRHVGVDAMLHLLSANGTRFYRTATRRRTERSRRPDCRR